MTSRSPITPVVELRQYTLHPGGRDVLVTLFERELIVPQEEAGMRIVGQFHDEHDADKFVWLRGFGDMETRRHALSTFYGGPTWRTHRDAANATMIDSDDVHLLRPAHVGAQWGRSADGRPSRLVVDVFPVAEADTDAAIAALDASRRHEHVATLRTDHSPNTFPALPVREGENVVVDIVRVTGDAAPTEPAALGSLLTSAAQRLLLRPTAGSWLR